MLNVLALKLKIDKKEPLLAKPIVYGAACLLYGAAKSDSVFHDLF